MKLSQNLINEIKQAAIQTIKIGEDTVLHVETTPEGIEVEFHGSITGKQDVEKVKEIMSKAWKEIEAL
jgi:hypothetical protein